MKPIDKPLTIEEMRQMQAEKGHIQAIIPWHWHLDEDSAFLDIDRDGIASTLLTGNVLALEDISYRLVGADVDNQQILIEVTGSVADYLRRVDNDEI